MKLLKKRTKQLWLLAALAMVTLPTSGCNLLGWTWQTAWTGALFFGTTPLIPVTPYFSQEIEDTYWEEERYKKVPILDPVEGENAPLFCLDPPQPDEVMRALPDDTAGGFPFLAETSRNNVRIVVEPMVDRIDECRFFPQVGPARLHHCHYKCTVYFDEFKRSSWPVPFTAKDQVEEVVYIDHDHLIRCAGPVVD
ncbi:hypothetical protein KOR42_04390 [Thalassoglobus neptunius]|uniref:Uncharacterized protein n=1 Tax=Thalassoglobus neptunius TaxID=1938619 RepID=A0A5C5X434_9PLAN|nr:hypothetical protein [Thalassoglobus neptunius]TWT57081.1 hypothetical protein KOR42_04390 [Thalassoglobus neptunius]